MNSLVGDCMVADTSEVNLDMKFEIVAGVTQIWLFLCVCMFCGRKFLQFEDTTVFCSEPISAIQRVENTILNTTIAIWNEIQRTHEKFL